MQGVIRAISIVYLIFLTLLLLSAEPQQLLRVDWRPLRWLDPWAHLLSFLMLAALALSVRWPVPRWGVVLTLVFYAGTTEIAQGFVRGRAREWTDWLMDLAGLAVGTAVCWSAALLTAAVAKANSRRRPPAALDQWEVMRKISSRPAAEQSWWG
ncbi:MAG: VanZ family protein [Pirellulales bacterium]|nr:VanZ family protein [Pirellulales bacterium]